MKKNMRLMVSCVFCVLVSCSQAPEVKEHEIVYFNRSDFLAESILIADTIDFDKPLNPKGFDIVRDSIIFVSNWANHDIFLELYNLNTKELIGFAAPKGRGPGEYLSCLPIYCHGYSRDTLLIYDPVASQLSILNIDSLLIYLEKTKPDKRYSVPGFVRNPALINLDKLIGWNYYSFNSQGIDNGFDRLFLVDYSVDPKPSLRLKSDHYNAINYSTGHTIVNRKKEKVFVADRTNANIYVYNMDLNLVKELRGPDLFSIDYKINHETKKVSFADGKRYWTYSRYCYTNEAIYFIYDGAIGITGSPRDPVEVLKFSWEGDLLHRYQLDQYIIGISVDSKEEFLYASSYTPDEYPRLLRYKLK